MSRVLEVTASLQSRGEHADRIADTMKAIGAVDAERAWRETARRYYEGAARLADGAAMPRRAPKERHKGLPRYRYPCERADERAWCLWGVALYAAFGALLVGAGLLLEHFR